LDKTELIDQAMALSRRLGHLQMRYAFDPWRKLDVPLAQLKSLFLIHIRGSLTVRDLALNLGVTPGNVTSIGDRLVEKGLLERNEDPNDRRLVLLELTDKGRKTVSDIRDSGMNHMKNVMEQMTTDDIAAYNRGINSFLKILEADQEKLTAGQHPNSDHIQ
jgi:MarR family transcriptional regulator, organic hydroperoxide resistance regulator